MVWVLKLCLTVLSIAHCNGQLCGYREGEWINSVQANITGHEFRIVDVGDDLDSPVLKTHFTVEWELVTENSEDRDIDGFIVSLIDSISYPRQTLYPIQSRFGECEKYLEDHIFLSSVTDDECLKLGPCNKTCLCHMDDCDVVNETECRGTKWLLNRRSSGSPFTVSSETQSLEFEVKMGTTYDLLVIPYYRLVPLHTISILFTHLYRENYASGIQSVSFMSGLCPEMISELPEYTIDDGYEICCRVGYRDKYIRTFELSPPVPDFAEGTFNMTVLFSSMFYNSSEYSINIMNQINAQRYAKYSDVKRIGEPELAFSTGISMECMDQASIFSVNIHALRKTELYQMYLFPQYPSPSCTVDLDCYASYMFNVPDVDTCSEEWGYCSDNAECFNNTGIDSNTTCKCKTGYEGSGISKLHANGAAFSECMDLQSCFNDSCTENAVCSDNPPPSTDFTCECVEGFYGNGYVDSGGCKPVYVLILAITIPVVVLIVIIIALVAWKIRLERERRRDQLFSIFNVDAENGILSSMNDDVESEFNEGPWEPTFGEKWEVDRRNIVLGDIIGRGNYGVVYKGTLLTSHMEDLPPAYAYENEEKKGQDNDVYEDVREYSDIAIKTLQESHLSHANLAEFLAEIGFLINVGKHENIVNIHGCCTTDKPVYLVTEFLKYGNLLHFLWDSRDTKNGEKDPIYNVTETSLLQMAKGVAKGMAHLSHLRIIHGDIAARNILVGDKGICKISDFGLANDVYRYGSIHGHSERSVPFKWISPERMMVGKVPVTYKSDVWSFGILLYEMFTLGCAPHSDVHSDELLQKLMNGYRMPQPKSCRDNVYDIMDKCWKWRASSRPNFVQIRKLIESAITKNSEIRCIDHKNAGDLDRQAYEVEVAKFKDSRKISHIDEGFEESCSNACSTGDISITAHSDGTDSGQEEPTKYVEDLHL